MKTDRNLIALEEAADRGGAGHAGVVIALAQHGRLLVLLAGADIDQLQRQLVVALIVLIFSRRAAGELGEQQIIERLTLLGHQAGEHSHVIRHEELIGPQPQLAQACFDVPPANRSARAAFEQPRVDALVDLLFEIADFLRRPVLNTNEANPHLRRWQWLRAVADLLHHRRLRMPRNELAHGFIDKWAERFLPRLMTADHFLLARLNDPRELRAAAAGKQERAAGTRADSQKSPSQHRGPSLGQSKSELRSAIPPSPLLVSAFYTAISANSSNRLCLTTVKERKPQRTDKSGNPLALLASRHNAERQRNATSCRLAKRAARDQVVLRPRQ